MSESRNETPLVERIDRLANKLMATTEFHQDAHTVFEAGIVLLRMQEELDRVRQAANLVGEEDGRVCAGHLPTLAEDVIEESRNERPFLCLEEYEDGGNRCAVQCLGCMNVEEREANGKPPHDSPRSETGGNGA